MSELYSKPIVPVKTLMDFFEVGNTLVRPRIIGGMAENMSFASASSGARIEIFPDNDPTVGIVVYDDAESIVFKTVVSGADVGDVIIGDYDSGQGIKYDKSAGTISYAGVSSTKTFYQTTVPTAENAGDLWFDTDDGNKPYRATAAGDDAVTAGEWEAVNNPTEWVDVADGASTKPDDSATVGATAGTDLKESGGSNASALSGLFVDMGSITAGDITLNSSGYIKGGQTAYNTGTGFWLGYSSGYKFSIGNPSGNNMTWNGSTLATEAELRFTSGSILFASADVLYYTDGSDVYNKIKDITINRGGTINVKWHYSVNNYHEQYSRVYRNGVAVGIEHYFYPEGTTTSGTVSENISGWSVGDSVQLYVSGETSGGTSYVNNFRIYVNNLATSTVNLDN